MHHGRLPVSGACSSRFRRDGSSSSRRACSMANFILAKPERDVAAEAGPASASLVSASSGWLIELMDAPKHPVTYRARGAPQSSHPVGQSNTSPYHQGSEAGSAMQVSRAEKAYPELGHFGNISCAHRVPKSLGLARGIRVSGCYIVLFSLEGRRTGITVTSCAFAASSLQD